MNKYIGTKIILAVSMMLLAAEETLGRVVGFTGERDSNNDAEGYLVEYEGGYRSWSPKAEFEAAYRQTNAMSFGLALEALKKGFKVARQGWNGKNMYLFLIMGGDANHPLVNNCESTEALPSVVMFTADKKLLLGWNASQTDMLADDWVIVE